MSALVLVALAAMAVPATVIALRCRGRFTRGAAESATTCEDIHQLAFYDPLTHLANRRLLLERLRQALADSARRQIWGALLYLDLDRFKSINDHYGHEIGDRLLRDVANRLRGFMRRSDTAARLGGDEFVVVLQELGTQPEAAAAHLKHVSEKLRACLGVVYRFDGLELGVTPSVGAVLFDGHSVSADVLLQQADTAMYAAKHAGRDRVRLFDATLHAQMNARSALVNDLRLGLDRGQFQLHYQPQFDADWHMTGVEALLRWHHPTRGWIPPLELILLAESVGLIRPLGRWIFATACRQLATWAWQPAQAHLELAINLSARQFHHPELVADLLESLARTGAPPQRLKLELTESALLERVADSLPLMKTLAGHGIGFVLDNFGHDYCSIAALRHLPVDSLKISPRFVSEVLNTEAPLSEAFLALTRGMGVRVMAEGVEREEQFQLLARHGCGAFQGYWLAAPVAPDELFLAPPGHESVRLTA